MAVEVSSINKNLTCHFTRPSPAAPDRAGEFIVINLENLIMKKLILILFLFILSSPVFGGNPFLPKWKASCDFEGTSFDLSFVSKSMDPTEDDMIVKLISSIGKELTIPIERALYSSRAIVSDEKNICDKIGGFKLPNNQVLLWLSRDDRPRWDQLSLVLIDIKRMKTIYIKQNIGPIKDPTGNTELTIRKKNSGYEIRLEKEWLKNTGGDSAENSIEDWMFIEVVDNKISYKWSD